MKALVLAAGYATRLYPITKQYPKPLLKVKDKHIIDYIIEKLDSLAAINEIFVVTNHKFYGHFKRWAKKTKTAKPITVVNDLTKTLEDRRGAIGDMNFAIEKKKIKDDLLVIGGDNLFDQDLCSFIHFAASLDSPLIGVYKLKNKNEAHKYGVAKLDKNGKVVDFKEKPQRPKSDLVAMCLYYFPKDKLNLIGEYMSNKSTKHDATGFYIDWLRKKESVYGFVFNGSWYDIGDHKFLNQAKENFTTNRRSSKNA